MCVVFSQRRFHIKIPFYNFSLTALFVGLGTPKVLFYRELNKSLGFDIKIEDSGLQKQTKNLEISEIVSCTGTLKHCQNPASLHAITSGVSTIMHLATRNAGRSIS
ncbi:unnamed protein product [Ceratitis capitata]|uniref:(Mediterranean fruit fly) hypothetical protein n=1 Tax=Ceratitis capitata TaxID=7213 RepID=A0A811URF8_CERCA|nr:unnamed protein product [Ceratitis capitata]